MADVIRDGPMFVRAVTSAATDPVMAVEEVAAQVNVDDSCFALAFVSGGQDIATIARELDHRLGGMPVFGCSSAGQITGQGYETDVLLLLVFPKQHFRCSSILIEPLAPLSTTAIAEQVQRHSGKFRHTAGWNRLGLVFTDGLSRQEDLLVATLEAVLDDLPIFGGSAGDALEFEQTFVLQGGQAYCNAAVLLLLETDLPFTGIGFDHFLPAETQIVITDADPDARKVFEINGAPAASEYARLVGCPVQELSPQVFAENPLLVEYRNHHYVRAISDADDAGALSFLAAIDDGLVMRLGRGQEIIETLRSGLHIRDTHGVRPDFILGFDCVLRKLEIEQKQLGRPVSDILCDERVFGFNTFGEQQGGVHMNQTFVGIAFFKPAKGTLH
ncbi:FIST N-terminal domain-containing protein [uncultured Roseobacter sp.]|uniref:FIST N-terminal domain-containing protein n=1 Tax=uncultured Roseobacter sp. TaxID=114847 RepID=UPI00262DA07A|nr:FIST N-terminal domain-containing protein [uncultured Roseobacter sp.]